MKTATRVSRVQREPKGQAWGPSKEELPRRRRDGEGAGPMEKARHARAEVNLKKVCADRAGRPLTVSELLGAVESCASSITRPIAQLGSSVLRLIEATHCIPSKKSVL